MIARRRVAVAGAALVAAGAAVYAFAERPAIGGEPEAMTTPSYVSQRCLLLSHDRHRLEIEAQRLADEELTPIFRRMDARVDEFAEWAFRWRTTYALMRRSGLGALSAVAQGQSVPERLRAERDGFVEEAFVASVVKNEDRALADAAIRWRTRMRRAAEDLEREHDTAIALYLGFRPRLDGAHAGGGLPPAAGAPGAAGEAKTFAMTRVARPMLVRVSARLATALVPASLVPEALGETAVIPAAPISVATLLGVDFLISRLDAWYSRDAFATEMRIALDEARVRLRDSWAHGARTEIASRIQQRREILAGLAGPGGCR